MTKVIDTSVWVSYFQGNPSAQSIIEHESLIISTVCLAELASLFEKKKLLFEKELLFIKSRAKIVPLDEEIALLAARIKIQHRNKKNKFGLADAIHYATALVKKAELVTFDKDFLGLLHVKYLS